MLVLRYLYSDVVSCEAVRISGFDWPFKIQTPGKYPEEYLPHLQRGESLKTMILHLHHVFVNCLQNAEIAVCVKNLSRVMVSL
jgi:hypothetical protein